MKDNLIGVMAVAILAIVVLLLATNSDVSINLKGNRNEISKVEVPKEAQQQP